MKPRRFNPAQLRYDKNWVPVLSPQQITDIAAEVLERFCPVVLKVPRSTPVVEIIQELSKSTGLKFAYTDLGHKDGHKVLGKVSFGEKLLSLDPVLQKELEPAFRFTAAHEIGHWVLHRYKYKLWTFLKKNKELDDDDASLFRLIDKSPLEWLEYQANFFAAELVMPRAQFEQAVAAAQHRLGIRRNLGKIYLSSAGSQLDLVQVLEELERVYSVSRAALRIRMKTLEILVEPPKRSSRLMDVAPEPVGFTKDNNFPF
ncbi:ImmA/IrrE family metallo-endopeptidase [Oleiharenicola lentus]|nr:ImmA/IrrE family metallo-endopeptidase [Oleiharenicola lentus]